MSYDKMDSSAVYAMFEDINKKLDRLPGPTAAATPAVEIANLAELQQAISKLNEAAENRYEPQEPQEHIHKHRIELMSNKVLIILGGAIAVIVVLSWIISNQRETIAELRDNDLKYRYIEMRGSAKADEILMLRDVFDFNRNADSIRVIRKRVEKYERLIKEEAEQQARARANTEQAKELKREAENIRNP